MAENEDWEYVQMIPIGLHLRELSHRNVPVMKSA